MHQGTRMPHHQPTRCGAQRRQPYRWIVAGLAAVMLLGCTSTKVETTKAYRASERLPRPERIFVYDFAVSPQDVKLGRGLTPKIAQLAKGTPRTEQEIALGRQVATALSEQLVRDLRAMGLAAERATGLPVRTGTTLMIEGHLLSIDQGNRAERMIIGLGTGRSRVETHVQVSEMTPEGQLKVEELQATAKGAIKPGMAEMMGVGALAGHLLTSTIVSGTVGITSEATVERVQADARRMAKQISKQLEQFFSSQGWLGAAKRS